jgi:CspA family cold shock protein
MHWFSPRKGYGCIQCEDGKDVFVHETIMPIGVLFDEGDQIEFEQEASDRGSRVVNIRKL